MSTLKTKLWEMGVTAEDLDCIVDDGASRVASRVNNEGMSEQLRFLEDQCNMSEDDIIKAVQAELDSIENEMN
ncbi:hypothetical protein [Alteromonas macleodii]|jgi:hypothetical protein|uniref:hypothetical protein n=1 Tax=Alteromonas macleodii TaxID=28108 RepID=UPI00313FEC9A|tara:strand:+ start:98948 stop:99166 length:219 start_codon:yes stop_codon:yes gene_type:complete